MRKFEGNINGKIYTNEKEFDKALSTLERTDNMFVSYKYVSVPDETKLLESKNQNKDAIECNKNYVSEDQYVKNITNKEDVGLDAELVFKLKEASNKSEIKDVVNKKIEEFDSRISSNLISINNFKSDIEEFEKKIKSIDGYIQTLDNANNNYYLNKKYYTNIKELIEGPYRSEVKEECCCGCGDGKCSCGSENPEEKKTDITTIKERFNSVFNNPNRKDALSDLSAVVEYFLKKY
jgi:hypothetical protein